MFPARMLVLFFYLTFVTNGNLLKKRGTFDEHIYQLSHDFSPNPSLDFPGHPGVSIFHPQAVLVPKPFLMHPPPSPSEIATAIAAAKEATTNVFAAQHRVQAAKNDLLTQQKIAKHKEAQAAMALQQTEAAAAVQRQQASAAANSVILAQQRLAQAKSEVAEQQRIAADKEAFAAVAIQRSAAAAADEIKKTESTAAKVAALQNSKAAAVLNHVAAVKDASLAATSSAVSALNGHDGWVIPIKLGQFPQW